MLGFHESASGTLRGSSPLHGMKKFLDPLSDVVNRIFKGRCKELVPRGGHPGLAIFR